MMSIGIKGNIWKIIFHMIILDTIVFCCQYATQKIDYFNNFCINCPLVWGTEANTDEFFCEQGNCDIPIEDLSLFESNKKYGLWSYAQRLTENHCYDKAAKVARQIANLPER